MFKEKWPEYLKSVPSLVETISADQTLKPEDKVVKLIELGTPALPFILDKIELGAIQLFPAINALRNDTENAQNEKVEPKKWVTQNKDIYASLKQYVLTQKQPTIWKIKGLSLM